MKPLCILLLCATSFLCAADQERAIAAAEKKEPLTLSVNIDGGRELILSDGSHWEVAPEDRPISSLWITPFPLKLTQGQDPAYPCILRNLNTQEIVNVKLLLPVQSSGSIDTNISS